MAVLWNPRAELREFVSIVESDPAHGAMLLRAANSARYAAADPIRSVRVATVRIGLDAARQLISSAMLRPQFETLAQAGLNVPALWERQLAVGLLVRDFAQHDRRPEDEIGSAFATGLLHSVGRLALAARSPQRYRSVVQLVREGAGVFESERQAFGLDSLVLTRQLARRWSLPPSIADALSRQDELPASGLPLLLHEAIEVADLLGFDDGFSEALEPLSTLPADHERAPAFGQAGGLGQLSARLDWFAEAFGARRAHITQPRRRRILEVAHGVTPLVDAPVVDGELPRAA